jgi:hypothetical protein
VLKGTSFLVGIQNLHLEKDLCRLFSIGGESQGGFDEEIDGSFFMV